MRHVPLLEQVLVVGPYPHGLLHQLYCCVEALAAENNLKLLSVSVVCPRCRQTQYPMVRAQQHDAQMCFSWCAAKSPAGPNNYGGDEAGSGNPNIDMGANGFASWVVDVPLSEQRKAVQLALTAAAGRDATSLLDKKITKEKWFGSRWWFNMQRVKPAHACRVLERYKCNSAELSRRPCR